MASTCFFGSEKTDLANEQMLKRVARDLGIRTSDIGVAGQKDRRAVTRQYISVPADAEPRVGRMESENLRSFANRATREQAQNGPPARQPVLRFVSAFPILVTSIRCLAACRKTSKKILSEGFPNPFGTQRFGQDGQTAELGFDLLAGRKQPRDLPRQRQRYLVRLALSAAQSTVFNATLESRLADGELRTAFAGDVMQFVGSSGRFLATNADAEQVRIDAGEIVPTGPDVWREDAAARGSRRETRAGNISTIRDRPVPLTPLSKNDSGDSATTHPNTEQTLKSTEETAQSDSVSNFPPALTQPCCSPSFFVSKRRQAE